MVEMRNGSRSARDWFLVSASSIPSALSHQSAAHCHSSTNSFIRPRVTKLALPSRPVSPVQRAPCEAQLRLANFNDSTPPPLPPDQSQSRYPPTLTLDQRRHTPQSMSHAEAGPSRARSHTRTASHSRPHDHVARYKDRPQLGHLASWSVSSHKYGYGVDNLRDGNDATYWQ